jgi:hypothetical protein
MAEATIQYGEKKTIVDANGNGRLDAISNTIKQYFGITYELSTKHLRRSRVRHMQSFTFTILLLWHSANRCLKRAKSRSCSLQLTAQNY